MAAAPAGGGPSPSAGATAYRRLLVLYPRSLREDYEEEMVLAYTDLRRRDGRRVWARLLIDLAVSVPRTRLESVMSTIPSARTVVTVEIAAALALSALALALLGPWALLVPLVLVGLALAERTRLARSLDNGPAAGGVRAPVTGLATSAAVLVGAVASGLYHVNTFASLGSTTVVAHNLVAGAALAGILVSAALLAVRRHRRPGPTG